MRPFAAPAYVTARVLVGLLAVALLFAAGDASARHRKQRSGGQPGDFSYYVLSLSWSPAFCLSKPGAAECGGPRRFGFIVHGLWPQYEHGWPERCAGQLEVPENVALGIADLMPARGLVEHEWTTHGTCSGFEPPEYFDLLRRAFTGVAIPGSLIAPRQAAERSPASIAEDFHRVNPAWPSRSLVVTCTGQGAPRLREVRLCLDRALAARDCSADAIRAACRAGAVIIPPIR